MRFFIGVFIVLLFFSCNTGETNKVDVSTIEVNFSIDRFDIDFYTATKTSLSSVKEKYPFFFPVQITDSISLSKIADKNEQELFKETQNIFKDFLLVEEQLISFFKHVTYYNPKFKSPKVITMLTNIDYENRVTYADSLLIISLDVYLGKKHKFYADYPKYIKENNTQEHIIVDVANVIIDKQVSPLRTRRFINKMIFEGKKMYLKDMYLPLISDEEKIGFQLEKLEWANANEQQIWKYFIENKVLFSTETKLNKRFLDAAPFSKFYMEQDNLSPGKIGVWVGWQIVKSYMKYNDVSLQELLKISETDLYNKSKYKPKK